MGKGASFPLNFQQGISISRIQRGLSLMVDGVIPRQWEFTATSATSGVLYLNDWESNLFISVSKQYCRSHKQTDGLIQSD
jgi:hypothetical protein